ncbi:MAG: YggT family protein [Vulcanimicrobiaceae bacterium]|jgi:YggT family protein
MCDLWALLDILFKIYLLAMLIYAVLSWVPSLRGRWSDYIAMIVEPVLVPVRRVIPPLGGLDLSFIVVMLVIGFVDNSLVRPNVCAG